VNWLGKQGPHDPLRRLWAAVTSTIPVSPKSLLGQPGGSWGIPGTQARWQLASRSDGLDVPKCETSPSVQAPGDTPTDSRAREGRWKDGELGLVATTPMASHRTPPSSFRVCFAARPAPARPCHTSHAPKCDENSWAAPGWPRRASRFDKHRPSSHNVHVQQECHPGGAMCFSRSLASPTLSCGKCLPTE
jgi:hypothetical protein